MNLIDLAAYLETNGLGIQGKSIFVNQMPVECQSGLMLRSPLKGTQIDYELPGFYKGSFQLTVRAPNYAVGSLNIANITAALTLKNTVIGSYSYNYIRPTNLPVVFPLSKGNLLELSVDFEVCFTD